MHTLPAILYRNMLDTVPTYLALLRIIVPLTIAMQLLVEFGVIRAVSPVFAPVMQLYGLPPELAVAWLTGMLVGLWPAVVIIFTLVPPEALSVADMTVLAALLLCIHSLPIENKILAEAGPAFWATTIIRFFGGMIFAALLHMVFTATGALSAPLDPAWIPLDDSEGWADFAVGLLQTLGAMFLILLGLSWAMELLRVSGILHRVEGTLAPLFALAGVRRKAAPCATIGLFLGTTYGGGMILREAKASKIPPRQIFITCIFMGFAHGIIEDTLLVVALGADLTSVLVARLVFSIIASAVVAVAVNRTSDEAFFGRLFRAQA